jgi:hypothetical protein
VLRDRNPRQVMDQTPGQLVIVGPRIADESELPINVIADAERFSNPDPCERERE